MKNESKHPASFRDTSGFLFYRDGLIFRQINAQYKENYEYLISSGLNKTLVENNLLIYHKEVDTKYAISDNAYKVIMPEQIPFISYPYEWCFSQLKNAALTTLKVQKIALDYGMILKDASAYNIQFKDGKPIFIDTLSFEIYTEKPWFAYQQFCQHFLAPLTLMKYCDIRLGKLLQFHIDGIPIDLTSAILPKYTYLCPSLFSHIHLHSFSQKSFAKKKVIKRYHRVKKKNLLVFIENLENFISNLKLPFKVGKWSDYYLNTSYSEKAFHHKKQIIAEFLDKIKPKIVWDLGANIGIFSRIASKREILTIAFDNDPIAVEKNYLSCVKKKERNLLPLIIDLTNPSPDIGWANQERISLLKRSHVDLVMALALIHHLVISHNIPLSNLAEFFSKICKRTIIEFVPKSDSQVKKLLSIREDIFNDYTKENFEKEFNKYFTILNTIKINDSDRLLYLMEKK